MKKSFDPKQIQAHKLNLSIANSTGFTIDLDTYISTLYVAVDLSNMIYANENGICSVEDQKNEWGGKGREKVTKQMEKDFQITQIFTSQLEILLFFFFFFSFCKMLQACVYIGKECASETEQGNAEGGGRERELSTCREPKRILDLYFQRRGEVRQLVCHRTNFKLFTHTHAEFSFACVCVCVFVI